MRPVPVTSHIQRACLSGHLLQSAQAFQMSDVKGCQHNTARRTRRTVPAHSRLGKARADLTTGGRSSQSSLHQGSSTMILHPLHDLVVEVLGNQAGKRNPKPQVDIVVIIVCYSSSRALDDKTGALWCFIILKLEHQLVSRFQQLCPSRLPCARGSRGLPPGEVLGVQKVLR